MFFFCLFAFLPELNSPEERQKKSEKLFNMPGERPQEIFSK